KGAEADPLRGLFAAMIDGKPSVVEYEADPDQRDTEQIPLLEDGGIKRILIDGQQRVTALMAALLGREVLTKDYETVRIRIAFHPQEERFEVANPAIKKDVTWIEDVAEVFAPEASLTELTDTYSEKNPGADRRRISRVLEKLRKIINNHVG